MEQNNETTYKVHEIENTPFAVAEKNDDFKIILGNQIVSEKTFKSLEDATEEINKKPWSLIFATFVTLHNTLTKLDKKENEKN